MQYSIEKNNITLNVKKPHFLLRFLLYFMSCIVLLGPVVGFIISVGSGQPFHIKYLFGLVASSLIGFYILRFSLWNSFGKEIIELGEESILYTTDYKLYRDNKTHKREGKLNFSCIPIGYIEDQMGCLTLHVGEVVIQSVIKMPITDINILIKELTTINGKSN